MKVLLTRSSELGFEIAAAGGHHLEIDVAAINSAEAPAISTAVETALGVTAYPLWEFACRDESVFLCEVDQSYWSKFTWISLENVSWITCLSRAGADIARELNRVAEPTAVPFVPWLRQGWIRELQAHLEKTFGDDCLIQPHKLRCDTLVIRVATNQGEFFEVRAETQYSKEYPAPLPHTMLRSMLQRPLTQEWLSLNVQVYKAPLGGGLSEQPDWETALTAYARAQRWIGEQFIEPELVTSGSSMTPQRPTRVPNLELPANSHDMHALRDAAAAVLQLLPMTSVSSTLALSPFEASIEADGLRIGSWEHVAFTHPLEALTPFLAGVGAENRPPVSKIVEWWSLGRGQSEPRITQRDLSAALALAALRRAAILLERGQSLRLLGTSLQTEVTAWFNYAKLHGSRIQS